MALVSRPAWQDLETLDAGVDHREGHETPATDSEPVLHMLRLQAPGTRRDELLQGLRSEPARIAPKFFYDPQGCALYDAICRLDEYYPPRLEAAVFERHGDEIEARLARGAQFVDLGCGDGAKALRWLRRLQVQRYLGVDIAAEGLRDTLRRGGRAHPDIVFEGAVTDFTLGLALHDLLPSQGPRIFFYPGSSLGNFEPDDAVQLLSEIREHLRDGDALVLGVDAPKALPRLLAAYDDALGVTAAFNLNVLRVVNAEIGSDFQPADFLHRVRYDEAAGRIEMHLVARHDVTVRLDERLQRVFRAGEAIVTEHSYKHTPERVQALLARAGFGEIHPFLDDTGGYGVYVAHPRGNMQ